jgi:tRNA(Arg) A34 adenosine deaminase TadA
VIVLRNEVIATGYNRKKTNPFQAHWAQIAGRPAAIYPHAEISCLAKLHHNKTIDDLHLAKIYVYRETKTGIALARPCEICSAAIKHYGIKSIYYTTNDGFAEEEWV